jgi:hypothetical protein
MPYLVRHAYAGDKHAWPALIASGPSPSRAAEKPTGC